MSLRRPSPALLRTAFPCLAGLLAVVLSAGCASAPKVGVVRTDEGLRLSLPTGDVGLYRFAPPAGSTLPVDAGGYFHPLRTPSGRVVTDFSPSDHRHHRGLFLAWVETHGAHDADFWGWGQHAPIRDRRIVHRSDSLTPTGFLSKNDWMAGEAVVLHESMETRLFERAGVHVLDLEYHLFPEADLTLSRWAFSGFCLRFPKEGELRMSGPDGVVELPNPSHVEPSSDWPDARWYAGEVKAADGATFGAAVFNHPANPPTLWHNHRDVRMINPCIVAPAAIRLVAGRPLVLRYRVATFDGPVPRTTLDGLILR